MQVYPFIHLGDVNAVAQYFDRLAFICGAQLHARKYLTAEQTFFLYDLTVCAYSIMICDRKYRKPECLGAPQGVFHGGRTVGMIRMCMYIYKRHFSFLTEIERV